jgi:hypothetical protein
MLAKHMGWFTELQLCRQPHRTGKRGRTWRSAGKPDRSKRTDGMHRELHEIRKLRQDSRRDTRKTGVLG